MARLIAALFVILLACSGALAQGCGPSNPNCIVPTAPPGTSNNQAASTAFVGTAVGGAVTSFNGRTGAVVPQSGDYPPSLIGALPTLASAGTYYVNGSSSSTATCGPAGVSTCSIGNDSNNCLTPATACLTLQHTFNIAVNQTALNGNTSTIYLAHNTGTSNYALACTSPVMGNAVFGIEGDSSVGASATVIRATSGGYGLQVKDLCTVHPRYVTYSDAVTNDGAGGIQAGATGNAGHIDAEHVTFTSFTIGTQVSAGTLGLITFTQGGNVISGGANAALSAQKGGMIDLNGQSISVTGTPAFGTAFAIITDGGIISGASGLTGSATGPRCFVSGAVGTGGLDPNTMFPGNSNCVMNPYFGAIGLQPSSPGSLVYGSSGQCLTSGGGSGSLNTWANCSGAGVPQNVLNTQTTNYTIATTDCGKTIQAGTGTTGLFTVTLPSVSGFASNCVLAVYNGDSGRGKILSGFPGALASSPNNILWPLDTITVEIVNGAWSIQSYPVRHKITASITVFVDNTNGNDSNDCLAATTSACKTIQGAINYVATWDGNTQAILISVADGTYTNTTVVNGPFHGNPTVTLTGDVATPTNCIISTTSADAIKLTNGAQLTIGGGFEITTTTSGSAINALSASFVTISGAMQYGATAAAAIQAFNGSQVTITAAANYTISGNQPRHYNASFGGVITVGAATITLSGTPAFSTAFATASNEGIVSVFATFSGSATGTRYILSLQGLINVGGAASASYLPGNAAGTTATRGFIDGPGTPGVSSCGGSPGAATGTDFSGNVVEGSSATGCTITFTTGSTFHACTVSLSSGNAVGISSLGSTLVVTHSSLSGNTLYWTCTN